jgi:hypothetical protein
MTTLPKFEETEITVEDGIIEIHQHRNYSVNILRIPISLWGMFSQTVYSEINKSRNDMPPTIASVDIAADAFDLLNTMNKARAEEIGK